MPKVDETKPSPTLIEYVALYLANRVRAVQNLALVESVDQLPYPGAARQEARDLLTQGIKAPEPRPSAFDPAAHVARIEGTLTFDDGTSHRFSIEQDGGWQQWGAAPRAVGRSVDLMEAFASAALLNGDLMGPDDEDEDEEETDCGGCADPVHHPHTFDCPEAGTAQEEN